MQVFWFINWTVTLVTELPPWWAIMQKDTELRKITTLLAALMRCSSVPMTSMCLLRARYSPLGLHYLIAEEWG
jgi:hypothetical protein